ncbi:MAG: DUF805 domain-containing protein [Spirochaetaceae bacterium]|jgi:uncharacterized membrane protein YhaH (DUF805 family)|nr:DUF805 domain-containing protein [Spirochaetaceae bacterium]
MEWYLGVLKKYAVFTGRARRQEYWMFTLFHSIICLILSLLGRFIPVAGTVLALVYGLAVFIPGLAVSIRRLHDTGRTGFFVLLALIPLVGVIILLIYAVQDSSPGENQYGANPKETAPAGA